MEEMTSWLDGEGGDSATNGGGIFAGSWLEGGGMMPIPSLTGGAGGDSGASRTDGGNVGGAAFDNSGWNVTFGANSGIESSRSQTSAMSQYMPYILAGGALLIALKWIKKKG